jgi:rare lipoprotein A
MKRKKNEDDLIMTAKIQRLPLALLLSTCAVFPLFGAARYTTTQTGAAVYYSDKMDGKGVSLKGERYDKTALTAATHQRFPLGSMVTVTNLSNNKSVTVKINDRMNPNSKAIIDLSRKAAEEIDMVRSGHAKVTLELVRTK